MTTRARALRDAAQAAYAGWLTPEQMAVHSPDADALTGRQRAGVERGLRALADRADADEHETALDDRLSRSHGLVRWIAALDPEGTDAATTSHGTVTLVDVVRRAQDVLADPETS